MPLIENLIKQYDGLVLASLDVKDAQGLNPRPNPNHNPNQNRIRGSGG